MDRPASNRQPLGRRGSIGLGRAHTTTMVCTPRAEDGMDTQSCAFVVTFRQFGTAEPTKIGITSQGNCKQNRRTRVPIVISIVSDGFTDSWLKDLLARGCSFHDRRSPDHFRNVWRHMHSQEQEWPLHGDCTRWHGAEALKRSRICNGMTVGITTSRYNQQYKRQKKSACICSVRRWPLSPST